MEQIAASSPYYDKYSLVLRGYYNTLTKEVLAAAHRDVASHLSTHGIHFEGKEFPVSLQPSLLFQTDIAPVIQAGGHIRQVLEHVINVFLQAHRAGKRDTLLH